MVLSLVFVGFFGGGGWKGEDSLSDSFYFISMASESEYIIATIVFCSHSVFHNYVNISGSSHLLFWSFQLQTFPEVDQSDFFIVKNVRGSSHFFSVYFAGNHSLQLVSLSVFEECDIPNCGLFLDCN